MLRVRLRARFRVKVSEPYTLALARTSSPSATPDPDPNPKPYQLEALHHGLFRHGSPGSAVLDSAISMPSPYFSARWPRPPCAASFLGPMWAAFRDRVSLVLNAG